MAHDFALCLEGACLRDFEAVVRLFFGQRHIHSRNFDNRFNFDADIEGQRSHSDGTACVPSTVAENLDKKVIGVALRYRSLGYEIRILINSLL
jgi:hypothetical protein